MQTNKANTGKRVNERDLANVVAGSERGPKSRLIKSEHLELLERLHPHVEDALLVPLLNALRSEDVQSAPEFAFTRNDRRHRIRVEHFAESRGMVWKDALCEDILHVVVIYPFIPPEKKSV